VTTTRRAFIGASASILLLPEAALGQRRGRSGFRGARFSTGVLSGDPTPSGATLLTRLFDVGGAGRVELEVARDRDFRRVVARRQIATGGSRGHSVKARVAGLDAGERYYYRFTAGGEDSPVGRFRTAPPAGSNEPVRFAFFSCADYTSGFYNAYELMAREDDLDFVVNLGDYIYAESGEAASGGGTGGAEVRRDRIGRELRNQRQAVSLADYRAKYALYRSDPALRRLHQRVPMISIWDDHEVVNNYAGGAPAGGLPPELRFGPRRAAGYRAWFENMPAFPVGRSDSRIYRRLRYGGTLDLLMLDERQYRGDQPCGDAVNQPPCPERDDPRPFLGAQQLSWLKRQLQSSRASWKVIGNQTFIVPVKTTPQNYATFDTWNNGYLAEREDLVSFIARERVGGVVFATGDFHTFAAADVRPGESTDPAATVAAEFQSGSITSVTPGEGGGGVIPGADPRNPNTDPAIIQALRGFNPWFDTADLDHHGYGVAEARGDEMRVRFRRVQTVKRRTLRHLPDLTWTVRRDAPSIVGQEGRG